MKSDAKIYVAGHRGLVGSAVMRKLKERGYTNLLYRTSGELDLRRQADVEAFFEQERPDYVIVSAAKVGGIMANKEFPATFLTDNLLIQTNIIKTAYERGMKKLLFLGSSCVYPKLAPQPMKEEYLLTGLLEPTNEGYSVAKIAGMEMCKHYHAQYGAEFFSVMPTNIYGPNDNFDLTSSHVIPALMRRFHEAKLRGDKSVVLWGTGTAKREFMHADDLADAVVYLMENVSLEEIAKLNWEENAPNKTFVNIGTGVDISINDLAHKIKDVVGYTGTIEHDRTKPDGTPRKLLDVSKLSRLGWSAKIDFDTGLKDTYQWYLENIASH